MIAVHDHQQRFYLGLASARICVHNAELDAERGCCTGALCGCWIFNANLGVTGGYTACALYFQRGKQCLYSAGSLQAYQPLVLLRLLGLRFRGSAQREANGHKAE